MPLDSPWMEGLTPKQARFVMAYVELGNATKAYGEAGYSATGNSAEASASRLLRNGKVAAAIDAETKRVCEKLEITQEWVLRRLAEEASGHKLEDETHRLETTAGSRVSALGTLTKCLGMQIDRRDETGEININVRRFDG